jgi:hypothetical protein
LLPSPCSRSFSEEGVGGEVFQVSRQCRVYLALVLRIVSGSTCASRAIANINEARELWIETAYEAGDEIPLPSTDHTYSGKLLLRIGLELSQSEQEE